MDTRQMWLDKIFAMSLENDGVRVNEVKVTFKRSQDSLTPSRDAQKAKDGHLKVSQVTPSVPPDVVVDTPHNHPKQLND